MTIIDLPMNLVYGVCMFGFACSRAALGAGGASRNWRRGYSLLERPETRSRRRSEPDELPALLGSFLAMMATGVPVAIAMAGSALVYILLTGDLPPFVVVHRMISGIDSFPLLAVPFFILAGNLMNNAGITNRIYDFALALVGWLKGGLGHVNIIGSVIFAGMSGTAIADAAGLGTIEIKAMQDHGYDTGFSVGVTAASATLGPIIPPSLPFVIYAMMANVSVGQLFLAGIIPGVVMAVLMMLTVAYYAHKHNWGGDIAFEWRRVGKAADRARDRHRLPARDVGAVAALGMPFNCALGPRPRCCCFVADWKFRFDAVHADHDADPADRRHDDRRVHADRRRDRRVRVGAVPRPRLVPDDDAADARQGRRWTRSRPRRRCMFIVAAASIFGWLLTATRVTDMVALWVLSFTHSPWVFLLLANLLMLFVGCFLEPTAAILILVPVLHAGRAAARHRPGALRTGHGAEPDDRPAASADGHGAVRACARGEPVDRADDDGDPAVAGAAAAVAGADHLRAADLAVAAARCST